MKKTFIIFIIIIIIILLMNINMINELEKIDLDLDNHSFSLVITKDDIEIYSSEEINTRYKYNTLMLPMDIVFTQLFENYEQESQEQTLTYNSTTLQINKKEDIITVPDIYNVDTGKINDTVDIEIEKMDGEKYIPIYLVANIAGVQIYIDDQKVYDNENYCAIIDAINTRKEVHSIEIVFEENESEAEISSTEYVGERQGALWREEALKRIEKYRKSDTNIIVKNQNGQIIENTNVDIKMTNNEFRFGTAIRYPSATEENDYSRVSRSTFNAISCENGLKWVWLADPSIGSRPAKTLIEYAMQNDMYVRGHCLWWDYACADTKAFIGSIDNCQEGTMAYIYDKYKNGSISISEADELINSLKTKFENTVLQHIEDEVKEFLEVEEWDVVNEPVSKQYFKYYLYDKNLLKDDTFLTTTTKIMRTYNDNQEYYEFLAKCFDKTAEINPSAKLILNSGHINGNASSSTVAGTIRIINNIKEYTDNVDALGVQYHVNNRYQYTPQSYYNQINDVLEQTGLTDAVVTEYDNYTSDKLNNYTDKEKKEKANYLRDTLIVCYSNPNISAFSFWVYNSATGSFVEEEWDVYEELMQEWLNDEQSGTTDENGTYSTRAYNGEYTATVEINGLMAEETFTVSPENGTIEIIIDSQAENAEIKQLPNKMQYIQGKEDLDLTGGILEVYYNDGTTQEISLSDENVEISSMDNSILGKQTIIVRYNGLETSYTVEVIEDQIGEISSQILQDYEEFEQNYSNEIAEIQNTTETILNLKGSIQILQNKTTIENSEELQQYASTTSNLSFELIKNNINNENTYSIINDTHKILKLYEQLNLLSKENNNIIDTQETLTNISTFESKVTYYEDLNVSAMKEYIEQAKTYVQNAQENSINVITAKFLAECSNAILDSYISSYLEANPVTVGYNTQEFTNQDVIVNLTAGQDTTIKITNSNDVNNYTITENGEYVIEYTRRNFTDSITVNVNWIDKQAPVIDGIQNEAVYTEPVQITVLDENLDIITLTKDGQPVEFTNGQTIIEEGTYEITATDKAKNETSYTFTYVDLTIPNYEIIDDKYIVNIEPNTTVGQFLDNIKTHLNISIESQNVQLNENDKITTGAVVTIAENITYILVVTGDVTGEGNVDIADLVRLNMYSIHKATLEGEYLLAGDVNHDGNVNIGDLVRLNLYSIGKLNTL